MNIFSSFWLIASLGILALFPIHTHSNPLPEFEDLSLSNLEALKSEWEAELNKKAYLSLNSGVGAVGYRTPSFDHPDTEEWIEVDLMKECKIDLIALVPTLWRDTELGFVHDAFPDAFIIKGGSKEDSDGRILYEYDSTESKFRGIAPQIIRINEQTLTWIRIEVSRLSRRAFDDRFIFQLAELMAFEGETNRALRKPLEASSKLDESPSWNAPALVDGILPYLMNSTLNQGQRAYVSPIGIGEEPSITFDLEKEQTITGFRLHAADQSDTVPATHAGEFGIPLHFRMEVANERNFSDARLLKEVQLDSIYQMGPFLSWNTKPEKGRFVRITALKPYFYEGSSSGTRIAFAEIEIINNGVNLALGKPFSINFDSSRNSPELSSLNDGLNLYGTILPQREWLEQLAERHQLSYNLKLIQVELSKRYEKQKLLLRLTIFAAVLLAMIMVFTIPYYRMLSFRKEVQIRERIAANLHDELGANLHAIGMLGDVAERSIDSPNRLIEAVRRIRSLTERTGAAARYCTNMLEAKSICEDLVLEIHQETARILSDHETKTIIEGEEVLQALSRRKRIDLYLFFKECITNINRHAFATKVYTRLSANTNEINLSVIDNGRGWTGAIPKSLSRRARLMQASVQIKATKRNGTHVRLKLKTHKKQLFI